MAPQSVPNCSSSDFGSGFVMKQWKCINRRRSRLCLRRLSLYALDLKRTKTRRGVACLAPPKTAVAIVVIRPGRPPPVRELIGPLGDCSIEIRADWCSTMLGIASRIVGLRLSIGSEAMANNGDCDFWSRQPSNFVSISRSHESQRRNGTVAACTLVPSTLYPF